MEFFCFQVYPILLLNINCFSSPKVMRTVSWTYLITFYFALFLLNCLIPPQPSRLCWDFPSAHEGFPDHCCPWQFYPLRVVVSSSDSVISYVAFNMSFFIAYICLCKKRELSYIVSYTFDHSKWDKFTAYSIYMIHLHLTVIYCFLLLFNSLNLPSYKIIRDKDKDYPSTLAP